MLHNNNKKLFKSLFMSILFLVNSTFSISYSQTPIDVNSLNANYVLGVNSTETNIAKSPCAGALNCNQQYNVTFNQSNGTNQGDLLLNSNNSFSLSAVPYNLRFTTNNVAYQRVINPIATTSEVDLIQYEFSQTVNTGQPNNSIDIVPTRQNSSEDAIKDQVINSGAESIFHNFRTSFQLVNTDVERIDILFPNGLQTSTPENAGFLVIERGGNDNIKLAAITSLGADGKASSYGPLENILATDWAIARASLLQTVSFVSNNNGLDYGPFGINSAQAITANFMSLQDLSVAPNSIIYGYSIFPGDVDPVSNPSHDLMDPDTFPKNTNGINGGLDLLYASGAFDNDNNLISLRSSENIPTLSSVMTLILILTLLALSFLLNSNRTLTVVLRNNR